VSVVEQGKETCIEKRNVIWFINDIANSRRRETGMPMSMGEVTTTTPSFFFREAQA
jgi:hypothetical protein